MKGDTPTMKEDSIHRMMQSVCSVRGLGLSPETWPGLLDHSNSFTPVSEKWPLQRYKTCPPTPYCILQDDMKCFSGKYSRIRGVCAWGL